MRRHTRLATATAGAALMLGVSAGAASAGPPVQEFTDTWTETFTDVCDLGTEDPSDDLVLETTLAGSFAGQLRARNDTLFFSGKGSDHARTTNLDTGLSWTQTTMWSDRDIRLLGVDGDVYTYQFASVVHFRVFDGDGRPAGSNNVRVTFVVVYDAGADEVLSESDFRVVGHLGTSEFCEDAVRFTT